MNYNIMQNPYMYNNYNYYQGYNPIQISNQISPYYYDNFSTSAYQSPVTTTTPNLKNSLVISPDTVSFGANNQIQSDDKKGLSIGAKWGLGTLATVGLGALVYVLIKGKSNPKLTDEAIKKVNDLVSNGKISKEYADIFIETNGKEGKSFIKSVYDRLAKAMGYDKYKPQLNILDECSNNSMSINSIKISPKGFPSKEAQVNAIRHELEHFRQDELVYRSFGREAYINAKMETPLTALKLSDDKCIKKFGKTFNELSETEIKGYKDKIRASIESKLDVLENLLKERGTIPTTSSEYIEANKYLQSMKKYISPGAIWGKNPDIYTKMKTEAPEEYKLAQEIFEVYISNPIEEGAIKEGMKIKEMYKLFQQAIS